MEDAAVLEEQQEIAEAPAAPKRKRGRPPKQLTDEDRAAKKSAENISGPRYLKYNSDSPNKNQKTSAAWAWADGQPPAAKDIADLTIYRDWPVTLAPLDDGDQKSIDKLLGSDANFIRHDQDLVDRYGAGEYRCYYNINPPGALRRLMFTAYVKCTHDFRDFPPTDRRIDDVAKVDLDDKSNGSYVAWLRATGKLKDEQRESKEKEEMAATSGVMAELVKDMAQDRRELTQRLLEKTEQQVDPPPDPPSPKEVLTDQLAMFKSLKELVPSSDPLEMVRQVIGMAQVLTQKEGNANADLKPLMDEITKLREESRATERAMWQSQLADIKERLQAKENSNPNVLLPDGSNLNAIVEKAVEKAVENGLGGSDNSWWVDPLKNLLPVAMPLIGSMLQRAMMPPPQAAPPAFPMPPATYQAGAPQQAQLPPPAQPQQQPAAQQQQGGAYTTGNPQLDALLMAVVIPLADCLRDGETGAVFASDFIELQGVEYHAMLSQVGVEPIANILAAYPPLAGVMKKITREKLLRFVGEFCEYKQPVEPQPA